MLHDDDNADQCSHGTRCCCPRRWRELYWQLTLSETSGSVGDLGTFVPLYVALATSDKIYPTPALFLAGLANVVTGHVWDVPMVRCDCLALRGWNIGLVER